MMKIRDYIISAIRMLVIMFVVYLSTSFLAHCAERKDDKASKEVKPPVTAGVVPKPAPGPAPVIPPELEIRYLRATLENQIARTNADATNRQEQTVGKELIAVCGDKYIPWEGSLADGKPSGRFVCKPKP